MANIKAKDVRDSTHNLPEKIKVTISCEDGEQLGSQDQTTQVEYLTDAAPTLFIQRDGRTIKTIYRDANDICVMLQALVEREYKKACHRQTASESERRDECRHKVTISREDGSPLFSQDQTAQVVYLADDASVLVIRRHCGTIETLGGDASWACDVLQEVLERDREIERELMEYEREAEHCRKE